MPDKKKKANEWFSVECWLELFGDNMTELSGNAERIMVLMISLRHMIKGSKAERKKAAHAIQNCVKACVPFTRTQLLADYTELKTKKHKATEQVRR